MSKIKLYPYQEEGLRRTLKESFYPWIIYEARSKTEGKVYVGRTQNLRKRKRVHKSYAKHYRSGSLFYQAIQRLGWEDFIWCVLCSVNTREEAIRLENRYIESYTSEEKYNMILQGGGTYYKGVTAEDHPAFGLRPANAKYVKCIETQQVFDSSIEAGRVMDISSSSIRKVCKGVHKQAKGYTFVYLKGGVMRLVYKTL